MVESMGTAPVVLSAGLTVDLSEYDLDEGKVVWRVVLKAISLAAQRDELLAVMSASAMAALMALRSVVLRAGPKAGELACLLAA